MYLLDANVLISAAERNYPPDVVPGFWDQLLDAVANGEVKIPEAVYREVTTLEDKWLTGWLKNNVDQRRGDVLYENLAQARMLARVADWVTDPARPYASRHVNNFLRHADPRLIAAAATEAAVVVTYEERVADPNSTKVKIPNVADEFGVACVLPMEMFRSLRRTL
ncbi:DUF4411 family protein [Corynebacterium sp. Q4381]|uniref:DUF4411 family protein n=1 Tax=Corynebacterium sp. Marseille-Q4381 TaxID=3121597 RepID=UPI002FE5ECD4